MFKEKLNKKLVTALQEYGIETPTDLQTKSLSKINSGADVIAIGPVNAGKSTLLLISVIHKLKDAFEDAPRALILVADMASAIAMKQQFDFLGEGTSLRCEMAFEEGKIITESVTLVVNTCPPTNICSP